MYVCSYILFLKYNYGMWSYGINVVRKHFKVILFYLLYFQRIVSIHRITKKLFVIFTRIQYYGVFLFWIDNFEVHDDYLFILILLLISNESIYTTSYLCVESVLLEVLSSRKCKNSYNLFTGTVLFRLIFSTMKH